MNITLHFKELRCILCYLFFCLVNTFIFSYLFAFQQISILSKSFIFFVKDYNFDFIVTNIFESFNSCVILCVHTSLFFFVPILFYFLFDFLKAGLFSYERKFLLHLLKIIVFHLILSVFTCYFILVPCFLSFFLEFCAINGTEFTILKNSIRLYDYIVSICKFFFIYSYLIFQIPTFILTCMFLSYPSPKSLFKLRRFCLLISFLLGSIFSSSDLFSFFFISVSLAFFFEIFALSSVLKDKYLQTG